MRRLLLALVLAAPAAEASAELWVTAYYPGWRQRALPAGEIDFSAITHLAHFGVVPRADGTLDSAVNMLTPANIASAVSAARSAGRKILFTVGGQASRERFLAAMSPSNREAFIENLVRFMTDNGYHGIDVDMEEIRPSDARDFARFIRELRARLDKIAPRPLLTAAALWEPALFARLEGEFDQINLMTYNLSGPYPGWVAWHSGALYDGGHRFPGRAVPLPSVDGVAASFLSAGVPREKLGVGMSFNAYVWSGGQVSRPRQGWSAPPAMRTVPYSALAASYKLGTPEGAAARWDASAQAAYLSVEGPDAQFVSYDNERSAAGRVRYARAKGLGGLIVWDMPAGRVASAPPGRRDPLLEAILAARRGAVDRRVGAR